MAAADSLDVTLVHVDSSILSCWEEKVKQGLDCSLLLKHSKGKIITTLKCSEVLKPPKAKDGRQLTPSSQAEVKGRKKKNKGGKQKKLESLLSYHQRLVEEKGLPPSRLMLQHAVVAEAASSVPPEQAELFQCDQCDFTSSSKRGVSSHKGHNHKNTQKPETLRELEHDKSLNSSHVSEVRDEYSSSFNADCEEPDEEEIERIRGILEGTNQCFFCGYGAPVPWVHPSKGDNLSGRDIWDHVWAEHPKETDWFA